MLALQRRTTPPQKIKSLFGTVLTTHHIDIVSLPISTGSSPSRLYGVRGKNPTGQALCCFFPHPSQNMPGKPESEGWADSKPLHLSLYITIIIIWVYVSAKSWVCRLDAAARRRGSSGRIPSPPRLAPAMPSGRASTGAEHHMPKPPRGFARGHVKEPCERGHSSCCRRSVGGRGGGARGRDVGRRSQKGQISSQRRSCRGATGLAANWEGP